MLSLRDVGESAQLLTFPMYTYEEHIDAGIRVSFAYAYFGIFCLCIFIHMKIDKLIILIHSTSGPPSSL